MVSIITPVHNSEKFVLECMDSVRSQTYAEWEHILVDDCSTDKSAEIIMKSAKKDGRIKYIGLKENSGAGVARNTAIKAATGNFIAFLDSDDQWYPEKLERQLAFMKENNSQFSFTSYDKVDEEGKKLPKKVNCKRLITYKTALYKNPIGCLTVMYSVDFFGKQYMPSIRKRQDYALWLKLLKKTEGHGLQEYLSTYRVRTGSISSNKLELLSYEWKIYREEEGLSFVKSLFYIVSAIFLKMKSYF
ncbi:glycosyltransferase family 2 protein [Spongiimicrobium salis]|uniref:glycosyltransferase family 2 protein n=1 Tax=Spongiimicrobium salis TaxID=1667022 RepID=UPI00374DE789